MAFSLHSLLLGALATGVFAQSSTTYTHSGIPTRYPNPYSYPHRNHTWHPDNVPNSAWTNDTDVNGNYQAAYSPARPPSVPLSNRSPYVSAWSSTANNGSLNSNTVTFWDGSALGWEGIITVDGISYEWMGVGSRDLPYLQNLQPASPVSLVYDSSYSNFTIAAGPIQLQASFFSPVIPQDYCRTSIPLSYLTVTTQSMDNATHNVSLYTDINGAWVTQPSAPLTWDIYQDSVLVNGSNATDSSSSLYTWIVQLQTQYLFGENDGMGGQGIFPQWGNVTWTSSQGSAQSIRFQSGASVNQRYQYVTGTQLANTVDSAYRAYDEQEPVFAFEHQLGQVGSSGSGPITFTIGHPVQPAIRYLTSDGLESLQPWWSKCYGDLFSMINFHWNDLSNARALAAGFESKLRTDIRTYYGLDTGNGTSPNPPPFWNNGTNGQNITGVDQFGQQYIFDSSNGYGFLEPANGCDSIGIAVPNVDEAQSYYSILALAARQVMEAHVLVVPPTTYRNQSEPLGFQKEISSSGNTNTIDVLFPGLPFFMWANPDLLRITLEANFLNQEGGFYPNQYSQHDLGSRFPNATGHVEGDDEYMPVEESGNMILMSYAIYKLSGNGAFLQQHYNILKQWAMYLIEYSLVPAVQLSTDDFAGQLANQTNLAIKGIVGLAAMAEISNAVGDGTSAANYSQTAQSYYNQWTGYAIDPSGRHTLLAYQWRSSWGLLYNVYPAKLLGLDIIPQSLYDMQSEWYPTVSQARGVPLDSRHDWTKSDWELWTAATCQPSTRRLFVDSVAYQVNTTTNGAPFIDLFSTTDGGGPPLNPDPINFFARPVQGGLFSLLALVAAGTN